MSFPCMVFKAPWVLGTVDQGASVHCLCPSAQGVLKSMAAARVTGSAATPAVCSLYHKDVTNAPQRCHTLNVEYVYGLFALYTPKSLVVSMELHRYMYLKADLSSFSQVHHFLWIKLTKCK